MSFWYYFWTVNFLVAGSAFAVITVVVLVRGSKDLLEMFARLKETSGKQDHGAHKGTTKEGSG